jgi:hypothetical protein
VHVAVPGVLGVDVGVGGVNTPLSATVALPVLSLLGGTSTVSASPSVTLAIHTDALTTVLCSLDGQVASACNGAVSYTGLADGSHTVRAVAIDQAGHQSAPTTKQFAVAAGAPAVLSTPLLDELLSIVTVTWQPVAGLSYEYSLDGVTWQRTSSLGSQLLTGVLDIDTLQLRGTDAAGNHTRTAVIL